MDKSLAKLEVTDIATIDIINKTETPSDLEFEHTKEKLSSLKNDAAETAECLASINTRIQEYLTKMEKLNKLDFKPI